MTLTPTMKFILIATAFLIQLSLIGWTAIKIDVLALGMKAEVFNIGLTVLTTLSAGATALLGYLGLRAPTVEDPPAP
jgi:hypothetical protein